MESPKGSVSSSTALRGKSPSWVQPGSSGGSSGGEEVFMCSLCAATTFTRYQTTGRLRAGTPGDQCIIDHVPGPGIDPAPHGQFVSSLRQIEVPTQLSENLCFKESKHHTRTHRHTVVFNSIYALKNHLNHMSCAWINQQALSALPPLQSFLSKELENRFHCRSMSNC